MKLISTLVLAAAAAAAGVQAQPTTGSAGCPSGQALAPVRHVERSTEARAKGATEAMDATNATSAKDARAASRRRPASPAPAVDYERELWRHQGVG